MKNSKFASAVNKSEPIGKKQIPRIIYKVSGYRMFHADSTPTAENRRVIYTMENNGYIVVDLFTSKEILKHLMVFNFLTSWPHSPCDSTVSPLLTS